LPRGGGGGGHPVTHGPAGRASKREREEKRERERERKRKIERERARENGKEKERERERGGMRLKTSWERFQTWILDEFAVPTGQLIFGTSAMFDL
jgi:septal ring factor EnvC (AmiA/AmiB activator)